MLVVNVLAVYIVQTLYYDPQVWGHANSMLHHRNNFNSIRYMTQTSYNESGSLVVNKPWSWSPAGSDKMLALFKCSYTSFLHLSFSNSVKCRPRSLRMQGMLALHAFGVTDMNEHTEHKVKVYVCNTLMQLVVTSRHGLVSPWSLQISLWYIDKC